MQVIENIPEHYLPIIKAMAELTWHINSVDPNKHSLGSLLQRKTLRKMVTSDIRHQERIIEALTWAVEHPDIDYRHIADPRFSNEDCVKLFNIYIEHIRHMNDEGPELVPENLPLPKFVPDDEQEAKR